MAAKSRIQVGRYSLMLPPGLLPIAIGSTYFDGYRVEVLSDQSRGSFPTLIREKEQEIAGLEIPKGLNTVNHRREESEQGYLVAYRGLGDFDPELL